MREHQADQDPDLVTPVVSCAIDNVAYASLRGMTREISACSVCDRPIEGPAAGSGLFMWSRGGELRFEEPALCEDCAHLVGVSAMLRWEMEQNSG